MLKLALFSLLFSLIPAATFAAADDSSLFDRSQKHLAKFHSKVLAENSGRDQLKVTKSAIHKNEERAKNASKASAE